ncbi:MAG: DUF6496 domain-containing protein [Panacagrimonas sp.]
MPETKTLKRAEKDRRQGKSASTQAGEFVREVMEHIREGKHGAKSAKQAIAIGLSKARRAGVDLPPPSPGQTSEKTRRSAESAYRAGQREPDARPSPRRSLATKRALKREGSQAASTTALSRQAHRSADMRTAKERSAAARKAVSTKGRAGRSAAARKAAQTRKSRRAGSGRRA